MQSFNDVMSFVLLIRHRELLTHILFSHKWKKYHVSWRILYILTLIFHILSLVKPSALAHLVERGLRMREIGGMIPGGVKPMTYPIDTCRFLARRSALIG